MTKFSPLLLAAAGVFLITTPAQAHVVVKPDAAQVGAFQTFTVGVPVEKDVATTGIRLVLPPGLNHVTPNVKQGWTIETKTTGDEEETVTEILWTGGEIPPGQRDEFLFSAQVSAKPTTITWKAYQTYADGAVVSWDQEGETGHDEGAGDTGPASTTSIVNDLNETEAPSNTRASTQSDLPFWLSGGALFLSGVALYLQLRRK